MNQSIQLVTKFYTAFQQRDFKTMQDCYHADIVFSDEVFPSLKGKQAKAMWHMLISGAGEAGLQITFGNIKVTGDCVTCDWEARYKFSMTGRNVDNKIQAKMWMANDKIIRHVDHFNFYRWARMAFGMNGLMLGWTTFFRKKVQEGIGVRLEKFIQKNKE